MTDLSYTLFRNGELLDLECDTPEKALEWGDEQLAQECADAGDAAGREDVFLVCRQVTDEGWQEISRTPAVLTYNIWRSDRDEHYNEKDYL